MAVELADSSRTEPSSTAYRDRDPLDGSSCIGTGSYYRIRKLGKALVSLGTQLLSCATSRSRLPHGYGWHVDEWDEDGYPAVETLRSGRRGRREVEVGLPDNVWRARAGLWIQALDVMTRIQDNGDVP